MDFQPEIVLSETLKCHISQAVECENCEKDLKNELTVLLDNKSQSTITFDLAQRVLCTLRTENEEIYLHTMLEGSDLFVNPVKQTVRDPELEARIEKLKIQQANKEYREMTKNVSLSDKFKTESFGDEIKALNRQLIAVFNFVVTVGGAFAFGYKAVEYSIGNSLPIQMMCGLIFATVVFFADLYFLLKYSV